MSKKTLANLLHKTPWLGLLLGGTVVLTLLVLFSWPTQVIRLVDSGDTPAERRAIRHEVGVAAGSQALDLAQNVVQGMRARTTDPLRMRELDQALTEIARARTGLAEARFSASVAMRESAEDAAEAAVEAATDAAESALEAATDARLAVEEAHRETLEHLQSVRVDVSATAQALDQLLANTRAQEAAARASLAALRNLPKDGNSNNIPPVPSHPEAPTPPTAPNPPEAPTPPTPAADGTPTTALALAPAVKDSIHASVADDAGRLAWGTVLILVCMALLAALAVAKFFLDRSLRPAAQPLPPTPATAPTKGWRSAWRAMRATHSLWVQLLAHSFIGLVVVTAGVLLACMVAMLVGWMPVQLGHLQLDGIEGLVVGFVGLVVAFGAITLALLIVLSVVYGLGFLFVALALGITVAVMLGTLPLTAPVILMGLGLWWLLSRKRSNPPAGGSSPAPL